MLGRVFIASADALYLLVFFIIIGMVLFGSIIFIAESGEWDPVEEKFMRVNEVGEYKQSPFESIPASFWWVLVTTTTVGYGDMVPTSTTGKIIGIICMHAGILVLALPITVIGAHFAIEYSNMNDTNEEEEEGSYENDTMEEEYQRELRHHDFGSSSGEIAKPGSPAGSTKKPERVKSLQKQMMSNPVYRSSVKKIGSKPRGISKGKITPEIGSPVLEGAAMPHAPPDLSLAEGSLTMKQDGPITTGNTGDNQDELSRITELSDSKSGVKWVSMSTPVAEGRSLTGAAKPRPQEFNFAKTTPSTGSKAPSGVKSPARRRRASIGAATPAANIIANSRRKSSAGETKVLLDAIQMMSMQSHANAKTLAALELHIATLTEEIQSLRSAVTKFVTTSPTGSGWRPAVLASVSEPRDPDDAAHDSN